MRLLAILTTCLLLASSAQSEELSKALQSPNVACLPPRLKDVLITVEQRFGPVSVISAYRPTANFTRSTAILKHVTCQAVDFTLANQQAALDWLNTQKLEVIEFKGAYRHIHVGIGDFKGTIYVPLKRVANAVRG